MILSISIWGGFVLYSCCVFDLSNANSNTRWVTRSRTRTIHPHPIGKEEEEPLGARVRVPGGDSLTGGCKRFGGQWLRHCGIVVAGETTTDWAGQAARALCRSNHW
jgi:hypothetical protein